MNWILLGPTLNTLSIFFADYILTIYTCKIFNVMDFYLVLILVLYSCKGSEYFLQLQTVSFSLQNSKWQILTCTDIMEWYSSVNPEGGAVRQISQWTERHHKSFIIILWFIFLLVTIYWTFYISREITVPRYDEDSKAIKCATTALAELLLIQSI